MSSAFCCVKVEAQQYKINVSNLNFSPSAANSILTDTRIVNIAGVTRVFFTFVIEENFRLCAFHKQYCNPTGKLVFSKVQIHK